MKIFPYFEFEILNLPLKRNLCDPRKFGRKFKVHQTYMFAKDIAFVSCGCQRILCFLTSAKARAKKILRLLTPKFKKLPKFEPKSHLNAKNEFMAQQNI